MWNLVRLEGGFTLRVVSSATSLHLPPDPVIVDWMYSMAGRIIGSLGEDEDGSQDSQDWNPVDPSS